MSGWNRGQESGHIIIDECYLNISFRIDIDFCKWKMSARTFNTILFSPNSMLIQRKRKNRNKKEKKRIDCYRMHCVRARLRDFVILIVNKISMEQKSNDKNKQKKKKIK